MSAVAVIGAGSWGTALAHHLARNGQDVTIFCREPEIAAAIERGDNNPLYVSDLPLAPMRATSDWSGICAPWKFIVWSVPTQFTRQALEPLREHIDLATPIVIASKGIENQSLCTLDQIMSEVLGPHAILAALSGPSFAREVIQGVPTAVSLACRSKTWAQMLQQAFSGPQFRAYTTNDLPGVEICGAVKNVIAIASGICSGMQLGHNASAALITRGLAEISRLVAALGGDPRTPAGLAGMGDLVLTCTGSLSRNRSLGEDLGRGRRLDEILAGMTMVAEGVATTRSVCALADREQVDMPIARAVHAILFEGLDPAQGLRELMARELKPEMGTA